MTLRDNCPEGDYLPGPIRGNAAAKTGFSQWLTNPCPQHLPGGDQNVLRTKHKIDKSHKSMLLVRNDYRAWLSTVTLDPLEMGSCLRPGDSLLFRLQSSRCLPPHPADDRGHRDDLAPCPVCTALICSLFSPTVRGRACPSAYASSLTLFIPATVPTRRRRAVWTCLPSCTAWIPRSATSMRWLVLARPVLKLLAHPWQQPCQCHTFYSLLEDDEEPTETKVTV